MIEVSGLTKFYGTFPALENVSFSVSQGEILAFLGPNGAGKTTTLKMLSGLIYPTGGSAQVLGFTPWQRADAFRRQFALVMGQKNQLWWDLPAADSFQLHREIYGLQPERFQRTLDELTELFGVGQLTRQPVRELSLGERMKMELIAALLHEPELLLLDEPDSNLDIEGREIARTLIGPGLGHTRVVVTHDPERYLPEADQVLRLDVNEPAAIA